MNLLSEVKQAAVATRKVQCPVAFAYATLDEDDKADLLVALADENLRGAVIQRVLADRGNRLGTGAVATHRAGRCSCVGTLG